MTFTDIPHLFVLFGAVAAAVFVRRRARRTGLSVSIAVDGLFLMIAAGLSAGHVADVLLYRWDGFQRDWTLLLPQSGGWCSFGAIAGGSLAGLLWFRWRDPARLLEHADNLVLALCLGWGIARIGCAIARDHLSAVTRSPLAIALPGGARHDLGLYEALLSFALYAGLVWLDRTRRPPGLLVGSAALVFGTFRLTLDFLREEPRLGGLTAVQYLMLPVVAAGIVCLCAPRAAQRIARIAGS